MGLDNDSNVIDGSSSTSKSNRKESSRMRKLNDRITQIIAQADVNNDGVVSYTEFLFAMADGSVEIQLQDRNEMGAAMKV